MAISKKTKKTGLWIIVGLLAVFVAPRLISDFKLRGTWNGSPLAVMKERYPGLKVALFGNTVTVSSRPDLRGTLAGNVITWNDNSTWTRA